MADSTLSFNILAKDGASRTITRVGQRFDGLHASIGKVSKGVGMLPPLMAAIGAGVVGKELIDMAKGAAADEAAQKTLAKTLKNTAHATDAQVASIEDYISKTGRAKGVTDDEMRPALANLVRATHDVGKAQQLMNLAMDVSRGTGKDLGSVTLALAKAQNGNVGALGRLGIATKDANGKTLSFQKITQKLGETFKGQASAHAGTLAGKMERLQLVFDETKESIGAKLLPVVEKLSNWILEDGLPALDRFGAWFEEHRVEIGLFFTGVSRAVLGMAKTVLPVIKIIDHAFRDFLGGLLEGAAHVDDALGGKLGLRKASDAFNRYSATVDKGFDLAIKKAGEWDAALGKTEKELKIQANIKDLEKKLKTAKAELNDKNLYSPRRAQIEANIADLETKLKRAKGQLQDPALIKERRAHLRATITDLTGKVRKAEDELDNPKLTATKRAKLTADIKELLARRTAAQKAINSLKGKVVTIDLKFTSAGVNLSAPSSVGRKAVGGPIHGPGSGTSDQAGLFALSNKEWVIRAKAAQKYGDKAMASVNAGTAMVIPMAGGGSISSAYNAAAQRGGRLYASSVGPYGRALGFAMGQRGDPYVWGGVGPNGYDCSGFMSAITNIIRGRSPYSRVGSTGSFPWSGFHRGGGLFSIGSFRGNPGHMAGTLLGVNVESRGGQGVVVGRSARGARNGLFGGNVWSLATGGKAGDAAFDLLDPRGRDFLGSHVAEALNRGVLNRDTGGLLPPGTSLVHNGTGRNERVVSSDAPIVIDARSTRGFDRMAATWLLQLIRTDPAAARQLKVLLS